MKRISIDSHSFIISGIITLVVIINHYKFLDVEVFNFLQNSMWQYILEKYGIFLVLCHQNKI